MFVFTLCNQFYPKNRTLRFYIFGVLDELLRVYCKEAPLLPDHFLHCYFARSFDVRTVGLVVAPLVWGLPMGLMSAELACAMPADGGPVLWVAKAYGPMIGFMNGLLHVLGGIVDNGQRQLLSPPPAAVAAAMRQNVRSSEATTRVR